MPARSEERTEFLGDIITTAIEGGTGYWSQVSQYQYVFDGKVCVFTGDRVGDEPRAVLHRLKDDESGYEAEGLVLTLDVVARGLGLVLTGKTSTHKLTVQRLHRASDENDGGEIDAGDADIIVQAGLLGEVVYG